MDWINYNAKARTLGGNWRFGKLDVVDNKTYIITHIIDSRGYEVPQKEEVQPQSVCMRSPYTDSEGSILCEHDILVLLSPDKEFWAEDTQGELIYCREYNQWVVVGKNALLWMDAVVEYGCRAAGNSCSTPKDLE